VLIKKHGEEFIINNAIVLKLSLSMFSHSKNALSSQNVASSG